MLIKQDGELAAPRRPRRLIAAAAVRFQEDTQAIASSASPVLTLLFARPLITAGEYFFCFLVLPRVPGLPNTVVRIVRTLQQAAYS